MIDSDLVGEDHLTQAPVNFRIGQVNPSKGYVHVFDDTTLDVIMATLDTAADFFAYLSKKEAFLTSSKHVFAAGEEELLAYYLRNLNSQGEHDFCLSSEFDGIALEEGHWEDFCEHPQRKAQLEANKISYLWDTLIETFSEHIMAGTQYYSDSEGPHESETSLRFLAAESRMRRRMLAQSLLVVAEAANTRQAFVRVIQGILPGEPFYVMLSVHSRVEKNLADYREGRRKFLEAYCQACKDKFPVAQDIVGIAVSPTNDVGFSEDLLYLDGRNWTPEQLAAAAETRSKLKLLDNVKPVHGKYREYPDPVPSKSRFVPAKRFPRNAKCPCGSGKKYKKCCGR